MHKPSVLQMGGEERISLSTGGFYRWNDAYVPVLKLNYYAFALEATYAVTISKLKPASNLPGRFERTLSFK